MYGIHMWGTAVKCGILRFMAQYVLKRNPTTLLYTTGGYTFIHRIDVQSVE